MSHLSLVPICDINMAGVSTGARIIVQCDWDQSLRENNGTAWVTFRVPGSPSVYSDLRSAGLSTDGLPYVTSSDGFNVEKLSRKSIDLSYQDGTQSCRCQFLAPAVTYASVHNPKKSVVSLDVTSGQLGVSADTEGKLKVWTTDNGEVRRNLEGHFGDVYTCRFFPSGVVVLSGGADMQLKIWSAETGQCAATLIGHKAGINDTAVIDRGRNLLSCARDGTAKLWDCGKAACLTTFSDLGGIVNSCAIGPTDVVDLGTPGGPSSDREVGTDGKLLILGCENGTLKGFGLQSRQKVFEMACSDAVNCCCFLSSTTVVCGAQNGEIYVLDLRNTSEPLHHMKENRSRVLSLLPWQQGFFASTGDGSCFYVNEEMQTSLELTGPDCDPVYKIALDGTFIFTACRDGMIRKYKIS